MGRGVPYYRGTIVAFREDRGRQQLLKGPWARHALLLWWHLMHLLLLLLLWQLV